ncbi:MAG: hypothetical protein HC880_18840 [Bacteroidia bacterium]|nr:hypothetical protein [Bacteroidia bacterium]
MGKNSKIKKFKNLYQDEFSARKASRRVKSKEKTAFNPKQLKNYDIDSFREWEESED